MPKKRFSLEFDKPARVEITWDGGWFSVKNNITIKCDNIIIGSFQSRPDLEKGQEFQIQDGALLRVQLISNHFEIFYNEKSVREITEARNLRIASYLFGIWLLIQGFWGMFDAIISPLAIIGSLGVGLGLILNGIQMKKCPSIGLWAFFVLFIIYIVIFDLVLPLQTGKLPKVFHLTILALLTIVVVYAVIGKFLKAKA